MRVINLLLKEVLLGVVAFCLRFWWTRKFRACEVFYGFMESKMIGKAITLWNEMIDKVVKTPVSSPSQVLSFTFGRPTFWGLKGPPTCASVVELWSHIVSETSRNKMSDCSAMFHPQNSLQTINSFFRSWIFKSSPYWNYLLIKSKTCWCFPHGWAK